MELLNFGTLLLIAGIILLVLFLWLIPKCQVSGVTTDKVKEMELQFEARKVLGQIVGGMIIIVGFYFTWLTINVSEKAQISNALVGSVKHLDSEKVEVRLGGLYGLERIAKTSDQDYWPIMQILSTFVRKHSNLENPVRREEIQYVMDIFRRRSGPLKNVEEPGLKLENADLRGLDLYATELEKAYLVGAHFENFSPEEPTQLQKANLKEANLYEANMENAKLQEASLKEANLIYANLKEANLENADLGGAKLMRANLENAHLAGAILKNAELQEAKLTKTDLSDADLTGVPDLFQEQLNEACVNSKTRIPSNLTLPEPCP